jgi:hypothetical protein
MLSIISKSPGEPEARIRSHAGERHAIGEARFGHLQLYDGEHVHAA